MEEVEQRLVDDDDPLHFRMQRAEIIVRARLRDVALNFWSVSRHR